MSELKVHRFITTDELFPEANAGVLYYEKSEADKVIARHKYKRCLAMAKWCDERICRIERDYAFWQYGKDYAQNFYKKWRKRWLAIAEKFNEAK